VSIVSTTIYIPTLINKSARRVQRPNPHDTDVVDASRLHVLCRAGRVESLFDSAPLLIPVVSDSDEDDDEAAFLKAASGALDE
jgi:hypothetical protein